MHAAPCHREPPDASNVQQVLQRTAIAWRMREFAILDAKLRPRVVRRQDSVLVIFERAVPNQEASEFEANARAVAVTGARAAKLDSVDHIVAVAEYPDRLSL